MNKIICFLLLVLNINYLNAFEQENDITYEDFVKEMQNIDVDSLLQWFLKVDYTKNSLRIVLQNNNPKNLSDIDTLLSKNNIEEIKNYYIKQIKINCLDKQIKTDDEYLKDLVGYILNNVSQYLKHSTLTLYKSILETKENAELAIEYLKLESENNTFLNTQKSTMINQLKKANSFTIIRDDNSQKSLVELEEEMQLLGLNLIKKEALLAFYFNSIAHRVAQGHGEEFVKAISHAKHLITSIKDTSKFFNDFNNYLNPINLVQDYCNPLYGKIEQCKIIPARYIFIMETNISNEMEKFLVGDKVLKLLSKEAIIALETGIRENNIPQKIEISETEKLTNIKLKLLNDTIFFITAEYYDNNETKQVKIYRYLSLLNNKFDKPDHWYAIQTNLFLSKYVDPLCNSGVYPTKNSEFNPNINLFFVFDEYTKTYKQTGNYIKILQNIMNYNYFINKYSNHVKAYFGSQDVVPRSIVLESSETSNMLWCVARKNKYFMTNTNFYNNQDKNYQCKNNNGNNKQALIVIMGYNNELNLGILNLLSQNNQKLQELCFKDGKFDREVILSNLQAIFLNLADFSYDMLSVNESDGSKSYYCLKPQQLYMDYLIEYDPQSL